MKTGFIDKLIERLDKLDPQSLQTQFLRLAQDRGLLETVFHSIQEGILVLDEEGKLTYANKSAEQLLGFSLEAARGRPVARYLRGISWDRVLDLDVSEWSRMIRREIEVSYPQHRFLSFYLVPLSATRAGGRGAVVILRDVTRDRQNEVTTIESERLDAIKLLAAGVAHEIGNPLNALGIHLQLIEREVRDLPPDKAEALRDLVQVARTEVTRLDLIITQFLRALRPSRPRLVLTRIETVLEETLALLKQEIEDRHIGVAINRPQTLPRIRVDRNQMKQAFFNVIRNALQAMSDGGELTITLSGSETVLGISFRDTGSGIKPEDIGRIFDPYFTTKSAGSGLGLMIVQRIVQDHGGQIEVLSKPEEGTIITLLLPLAERRVRLLQSAGDGRPAARGGEASVDEEDGDER